MSDRIKEASDIIIVSDLETAKSDGIIDKIREYFGPNTADCFEKWIGSKDYAKGCYRLMWQGSIDQLEISPLNWELMKEYVTVFDTIRGFNAISFHSETEPPMGFTSKYLEAHLGKIVTTKNNVVFVSKDNLFMATINKNDHYNYDNAYKKKPLKERSIYSSLYPVDILPDYQVEDVESMGSEKYPDMMSGLLHFEVIASYNKKKFNLPCCCDVVGDKDGNYVHWTTFDHIDCSDAPGEDPYFNFNDILEELDSDSVCDFIIEIHNLLKEKHFITFL